MKKLLCLLFPLIIVYSCKKKPSYTVSPVVTEAKISSVVIVDSFVDDTIIYRISYDQKGRVDSMRFTFFDNYVYKTVVEVFDYYNGYYTISSFSDKPYIEVWRIDVNNDGTISHYNKTNLVYNDKGQLIFEIDSIYVHGIGGNSFFDRTDTFQYHWDNNNNCTDAEIHLTDCHISYDITRQGQTGDCGRIHDFLIFGKAMIKTANLPTTTIDDTQHDCTYLYDKLGRIVRLDFPGYNYTYQYY